MVSEQDILRKVPELLAELAAIQPEFEPARGDGADLVIRLGNRVLVVEAKSNSQAGAVSAAADRAARAAREIGARAIGVVAVPFMGELGQRICREAGVGFIDLSGNVSIKAPPLLIHVEGRPNRFVPRGRPSSVFAPKSSRIARLMLLDPKRWWMQQELSESGELGAGYVSRTCKRLESERLIERNADRAVRPRDAHLLLDAWRNRYDFAAHKVVRGHLSARSGEELASRVSNALEDSKHRYAMTGLAAAWLIAPFASYRLVSVYLDASPSEELLEALKCHREERGSNLWLVRPNDAGVFQGGKNVNGVPCVSAAQVYLDLGAMPERSEEAAEHLRKERLQWQ